MEEVRLPENLEIIGEGAFYSCINLKKINMPIALKIIGKQAFYNNAGISRVRIPSNVTEIT